MSVIAQICALGLGSACASATPGRTVSIAWRFEQDATGNNANFSTDDGTQVHLDAAFLGLGAAYVYAPAPGALGAVALLSQLTGGVAHAHGGLDAESGRRVRAELLEPLVIDVLAEETKTLPETSAEAGAVDAVKLELCKRDNKLSELQGGSVYLRGQVEREGVTRSFEAGVALDDGAQARSVDLTGLVETLEDAAVLHVDVKPREWLRHAAFRDLSQTDADATIIAAPDSQLARALTIGVRSPDAFRFHVAYDR